jgi:hypothetical protein
VDGQLASGDVVLKIDDDTVPETYLRDNEQTVSCYSYRLFEVFHNIQNELNSVIIRLLLLLLNN